MKSNVFYQSFFIFSLFPILTICQLNMYNTDQELLIDTLKYDCLTYFIRHETIAYQELSDVIDETISYCVRPSEDSHRSTSTNVSPFAKKLTFEQAYLSGITASQLLSWSIPLETIEKYQYYIEQPKNSINEDFYNCTPPWFGIYCQYSFPNGEKMSLNDIVEEQILERTSSIGISNSIGEVLCYNLLKCHRGGRKWCLDWREVCDGKVDCSDEGIDEKLCYQLEINECSQNEYRCHTGMCISEDLWEDGVGETECLDRSDSNKDFSFIDSCYRDPSFRCEEHSCRSTHNFFSCGDGQCVQQFEQCHNGRHELLINSLTVKGTLSDECLNAMMCLTGLNKKCNEDFSTLASVDNSTIITGIDQCDALIRFPTTPVYSDHVYLLFENPGSVNVNISTFLLPDYICYDQQQCDSILPDFTYENQTCINRSSLLDLWNMQGNPWIGLLSSIKLYFRSCSIFPNLDQNNIDLINNSSLYRCEGSSKLISTYRIMDDLSDCFHVDDEYYEKSCELNDRFREKCIDQTKCWSPLVKSLACAFNGYGSSEYISFQSFCNGIENYFFDNNGTEHDDEFGCGNWSCNNLYARYDGHWACVDGKDEEQCGQQMCPSKTYPCISPTNFSVSCLPPKLVNDGIANCLGHLDEQHKCLARHFSMKRLLYPYHCFENDKCIPLSKLCDNQIDCIEGDDEKFCQNQPLTCNPNAIQKYNQAEKLICTLQENEKRRVEYFSVLTCSNYPSKENINIEEFTYWPQPRQYFDRSVTNQHKNNSGPYYCNRGLVNNVWTQNDSIEQRCICSPSYYGSRCDYASQRVSISLKLRSNERSSTYVIVMMLIDDDDDQQQQMIQDYNQYTYVVKQSCSVKLNRYLEYPTRPKNESKNYSIRIDVFDKSNLVYKGSWYYPIVFPFLPVNRFGISINISNHLLTRSSNCSRNCNNGECVKYINSNKSFCRCYSQWTGFECNIRLNCDSCSSDSLCIGSTKNHSVCVCPKGKFGRRCHLTSVCPKDACHNNGDCIPTDVSIPGNNYTCLCSVQFFGEYCQYQKAKLDVSLTDITTPSYLVAYFFTLSNQSDPVESIVLRKFTLFQHSVSFHISVPFQLAFVRADNEYYLATLQQIPRRYISTSISPSERCPSTDKLLNETVLNMIPFRRILYLHLLCQHNYRLTCFVDKTYLCLCTKDHHANCLPFNSDRHFECPPNDLCQNEGQCLQDHPTCPSKKICVCSSCFYGDRCQYYAKGMGSTLDEILGYEIKSNTKFSKQPFPIQFTAAVIIIMLVVGLLNSIASILTFSRKPCREVGCGLYLLSSSITSMIIMILYKMKFWFLFYSYQNLSSQKSVIIINCFAIEPVLKIFLCYDNWLNAFVAIDRFIAAVQGVHFSAANSRRIASYLIKIWFVVIIGLFVPQLIYLRLFHDDIEDRTWCVVKYIPWVESYTTALIYIHYFMPFVINILSIIALIGLTAYQKRRTRPTELFITQLRAQLDKHKHVLISTCAVIVLTLPHLIISFQLACQKSSSIFWASLLGYLFSFFPATFIFFIYALPSPLYRKEFIALMILIKRRFEMWKLNSGRF